MVEKRRKNKSWKTEYMILERKLQEANAKIKELQSSKEEIKSVGDSVTPVTAEEKPQLKTQLKKEENPKGESSLNAKIEGSGVEQKDASQSLEITPPEKDEEEKPKEEKEEKTEIKQKPDFECSACQHQFFQGDLKKCPNCSEDLE